MNYGSLSNDMPLAHVSSGWFVGNKPAVRDQNFDRADHAFRVADGSGAVDTDISRGDGQLVPSLQPVEQELRGILVRWFGRRFGWSAVRESIEDAGHSHCPFRWKMWALGLEYHQCEVCHGLRAFQNFPRERRAGERPREIFGGHFDRKTSSQKMAPLRRVSL